MVSERAGNGSWRRRRRALAVGLVGFLGLWLVASALSYALSLRSYLIPTGSMAPTIVAGDRVGVKAVADPRPKRGEVWVFRMPEAAGTAGSDAVKRVIGLPGETVEVSGGRVLIDGKPLDEPYLPPGAMTYTMPPQALGPDAYFVMGDSRDVSHDSHVWGPLPRKNLVGPVTIRFWPPRRVGGL